MTQGAPNRRVIRTAVLLALAAHALTAAVALNVAAHNHANAAARDHDLDDQYARAIHGEDRAYGAANVRAQLAAWRAISRPPMKVVLAEFAWDGSIGLTIRQPDPRESVLFYTADPADLQALATPNGLVNAHTVSPSDVDPAAPLRVVRGAERLDPNGRSMNIDSLTLREYPDRGGVLLWTLISDESPSVRYYADLSGRRIALSRKLLSAAPQQSPGVPAPVTPRRRA